MKLHGKVHSSTRPQDVEITDTAVFVATNIQAYSKQIDDYTYNGFEYDWTEYTKDEYLLQQGAQITSLQEELQAAKILLGVD